MRSLRGGGAHYPGDFWRACILCTHPGIPQNFENKSLGKYISKALFEGLFFLERRIFGGAYLRREICVAKLIGLAL